MHRLLAIPQYAACVGVAFAQQAAVEAGRLREISVAVSDVFTEADRRPVLSLLNRLHWETRKEVVRREIWLQPGEIVTRAQAEELERNLRALGLFAEVTVRLLAAGDGEHVDLEVITKDRLTLRFGAGASHVGGVTKFRADIGESNLFGYGNRIGVSFAQNSDEEFRGNVTYTDLHVLDTWHTGTVRASRTEDGDSFGLNLRRPFKHLADPRGYGVVVSHDEVGVDYYRGGDSLAEVLTTTDALIGDYTWASGSQTRRRFAGILLELDGRDYDPASGVLAPMIRVPGSTVSLFAGLQARWDWIEGYRKVVGLDTLDYVQDLTLGLFFGGSFGVRWRDEQGQGSALQPRLAGDVRWAAEPWTDVFVDLTARGSLRWDGDEAVGWSSSAGGWLFAFTGERNVLGTNLVFDAIEELQDLPIELTLGEDNGLRGYPAHEFAGNARVRWNIENRYDTGIEIATLHLGAVVFADSGWVGHDSDLGRPYRSAGIGLRVGSRSLLGDDIFRIDLAKPFDDAISASDGWKVSASIGQVIEFGGNTRSATAR